VTKLIKKSNDFGAGGVSVAIGELSAGLDIYLDRVPVKYSGLNPTELAISESQERMAVVVEAKDRAEFEKYCLSENVEVTHVADVTDRGRMRMTCHGQMVADLSRDFIDSAGAKHYAKACIGPVGENPVSGCKVEGKNLQEKFASLMKNENVCSQKGLIEMFDSTIGRSTVLMPFGGKTQESETQVSCQKLPVDGYTDTASIMAFGYNPFITGWSPYHGAAYSVVEACAKVVAAGGDWSGMRFSYQEYFERMTSDPHSWGKPLSALLGTLKMQLALGLPSIGGKDSMSGSFEHINVPPTLIAFGITTVNASKVISTDFKKAGNYIYLIKHTPLANRLPDTDALKANWSFIHDAIDKGTVVSGWSVGFGGVAEGLVKMSLGNRLGVEVGYSDLFAYDYGSIIVESTSKLDFAAAVLLGKVTSADLVVNGEKFTLDEVTSSRHQAIYPARVPAHSPLAGKQLETDASAKAVTYKGEAVEHPVVYIPVFPGTNCDYDTAKAFRKAGAEVRFGVFCNLTPEAVLDSIARMKKEIDGCHVLALSGGFSAGDEPDGSGKFIANVIANKDIAAAIEALLSRGGLILGICNGFQALVKSGLLPYGKPGSVRKESPTLFRNDIARHISQMVTTEVATVASPWLQGLTIGERHTIAISHGEGKFVVSEELAKQLEKAGQVAFRYVDNPNGSYFGIEGIIDASGQILGKMGHTERYETNVFKNIDGNLQQPLFDNAVKYFRKW